MTKKKLNVVILEDDKNIADEISFRLELLDINTTICHCIAEFDDYLASNQPFNILILDLGLPDGDGIDVAKRLSTNPNLRIVMLTARAGEKERIQGFQAGGDIYLTKPVSLDELSVVVKRLSKRLKPPTDVPLETKTLAQPMTEQIWIFDPLRDTLTMPNDENVILSTQESMMIRLFATSPQQLVSRQALQNAIWQREDESTNQRLLINMGRLKTKLKQACNKEIIKTHWRMGYQFIYPIEII